jgi:hypothetical protein
VDHGLRCRISASESDGCAAMSANETGRPASQDEQRRADPGRRYVRALSSAAAVGQRKNLGVPLGVRDDFRSQRPMEMLAIP